MRLLPACAVLALCAALSGDEIHLADGSILDGEVVPSGDPAVVAVRFSAGGMSAVRRLPAAEVVQVAPGPSARQRSRDALAADERALATGGDAPAWMALAERARQLGDGTWARRLAEVALARDPQCAAAHRLFGRSLVDGRWLTTAEAARAAGKQWHDGRWMSPEEIAEQEAGRVRRHEERLAALQRRAELAEAERRTRQAESEAAASSSYTYVSGVVVPGWRTGGWPVAPALPLLACPRPAPLVLAPASGGSLTAAGRSSNAAWSLTWGW
jgi:hypothetical protein